MPEPPSTDDLLLGVLTLLADEREHRLKDASSAPRTELLLSNAGLSNELIARVLNKNPDAVRMMVARAKKSAPAKKGSVRSNVASETKATSDA